MDFSYEKPKNWYAHLANATFVLGYDNAMKFDINKMGKCLNETGSNCMNNYQKSQSSKQSVE